MPFKRGPYLSCQHDLKTTDSHYTTTKQLQKFSNYKHNALCVEGGAISIQVTDFSAAQNFPLSTTATLSRKIRPATIYSSISLDNGVSVFCNGLISRARGNRTFRALGFWVCRSWHRNRRGCFRQERRNDGYDRCSLASPRRALQKKIQLGS